MIVFFRKQTYGTLNIIHALASMNSITIRTYAVALFGI